MKLFLLYFLLFMHQDFDPVMDKMVTALYDFDIKIDNQLYEALIIKDPEPIFDFESLDIPFIRINNLIVIEATIDGQRGYFILDTGAPYLILNKIYFRDYNLIRSSVASAGIAGFANAPMRAEVQLFQLSDITYKNIHADLIDLSHIEDVRKIKILGLIGFNLLKKFEIELNVSEGLLSLYKLSKSGDRICPRSIIQGTVVKTLPLVYADHVAIIEAKVDGRKLKFCIDTAAESNVLDSRLGSRILRNVTIRRRIPLISADGRRGEVLHGILNNFVLKDHTFLQMNTMIINLELMSKAYEYHIDGMLGFDFLSQGIISINCVKKEFTIEINSL